MNFVTLIILDGWGIAPAGPGNAISLASLPYYHKLLEDFPHGQLEASGEAVGLPRGEMGNTETGHLNLGAGYVVPQDLQRINYSIADGSFFQNRAYLGAIDHARKYESNLHLLGLIGAGGVHSNLEHLLALLELMKEQDFTRVYLHLITDGRDSPPKSASIYLSQIENFLKSVKIGQIATIMGRYYALDRDKRWDRTEKAYLALTTESALRTENIDRLINESYQKGITDEFILPTVISRQNRLMPRITDRDSLIFFNYRIDRPRQLTKAFVLPDFAASANLPDFDPYLVKYYPKHQPSISEYQQPFKRDKMLSHLYFVTMTEYSQAFHVSQVAFPPHIVATPLGKVLEDNRIKQLHASESEKERFVTYYFNGQREVPFKGQKNLIVPSPSVSTYDLKPEMSALILTEKLLTEINKKKYPFILVNYANPDMVAHTGNIRASIKACQTIDKCLSQVIPAVISSGGTVILTADHGNAEEIINQKTGGINTEHSVCPVPVVVVSSRLHKKPVDLSSGILADIAPTVLSLLNLSVPRLMTGRNLLENILH